MTLGVVKKRKHHETELSLSLSFLIRDHQITHLAFLMSQPSGSVVKHFVPLSLSLDYYYFIFIFFS